jgi:hypothetical protein
LRLRTTTLFVSATGAFEGLWASTSLMLEAPQTYFCLTEAEKTRANMLNANTANVRIESQSSSRCHRLKHPLR